MTPWRVQWSADAEADLGQLLYDGLEPTLLSAAVQSLEAALQIDPAACGESRDNNERIVVEPPLVVLCRLFPDQAVVEIFAAWQSVKR